MANFKLDVIKVKKNYEDIEAVKQASFEIRSNSRVIIQGPSGSGKTTLLRLLAGLEIPDEGQIFINGHLAGSNKYSLAPHLRKMGFVFQSPALWPHLTVRGNILFGLDGQPKEKKLARLDVLLDAIELTDYRNRYPDQLSGGEARRVALARSLAPEPHCLLMDEPLTSLDDSLKEKMLGLIGNEINRTGSAMVYVTHDHAEASVLGGTILNMKDGSLE